MKLSFNTIDNKNILNLSKTHKRQF